jgi:ABC-type dipeptide/oligopeptide/nickel transport system permease component
VVTEPKKQPGSSLLESHPTWTRRTTLMAVSDIVIKPLLALLGVATLFFVRWWVAGDPLLMLLEHPSSPAEIDAAIQAWGLNQPLAVQYWVFLFNLVTLRFLTLKVDGATVGYFLALRLPDTLTLVLVPFFVVAAVFTVYNLRFRHKGPPTGKWSRRLYSVLFCKSLWIDLF